MKAWIVRQSAFSIQCGGLERLHIHWSKPYWALEPLTEKERDIPFGYHSESRGYWRNAGWQKTSQSWLSPLSVGQWIGYAEEDNPHKELAEHIWIKLCEHFKNAPFAEWHELEKSGECLVKDFILEIDLIVNILNPDKDGK